MRIGYACPSTLDQNPERQLEALSEAGCGQVFQEDAFGRPLDRVQLEACLRALRTGDTLVVWRLDRLAQSLKGLVEIVHGLEGRGIGFQSLTEAIDTTQPGGQPVFHVFGALAAFEHNLIRDRTLAGMAAARARGRVGGRRPKLSKADVRRAVAMLKDPRMTKTEVATHFGISRVTLNAALERAGLPQMPSAAQKNHQENQG